MLRHDGACAHDAPLVTASSRRQILFLMQSKLTRRVGGVGIRRFTNAKKPPGPSAINLNQRVSTEWPLAVRQRASAMAMAMATVTMTCGRACSSCVVRLPVDAAAPVLCPRC
jgi:hypothetical protein